MIPEAFFSRAGRQRWSIASPSRPNHHWHHPPTQWPDTERGEGLLVLLGQQDAGCEQHGTCMDAWMLVQRQGAHEFSTHRRRLVGDTHAQPEVQNQEKYKKILGAMKEDELRNYELIKAREKERIAQESGAVRMCVGDRRGGDEVGV